MEKTLADKWERWQSLVSPCWGLMVSEGVPGSNDRAAEVQLPQSGHAIPNTGKIYAAPRVALFGSWNWKLCFWFIWWWAVLKCSYCVFGVPSLNLGLNLSEKLDSDQHHHHPFDTALNFYEEKTGSNLSEGFERSNWSVTGGDTAVNWHDNNWAAKYQNTIEYHAIPLNTIKYHQIPSNTINYHQIPSYTIKYQQIPTNFYESQWIPTNPYKSLQITSNTI